MGALDLLEARAPRKLAFARRYASAPYLARWLDRRDLGKPWTEGNYFVNTASLLLRRFEDGDRRCVEAIEALMDWHEATQDPESGFWYDPSASDLCSAMAGAAHDLHLYYRLGREVPRYERIVDAALGLLAEGVSSACLDIDVVDVLANLHSYGYRRAEIEAYLEKKLSQLLDVQNSDGGFPDVLRGERGFDGWAVYKEPQGLSNTFATFFRLASIAMCASILSPATKARWRFRPGIGMGYFRPEGLHEPPARPFPPPDPARRPWAIRVVKPMARGEADEDRASTSAAPEALLSLTRERLAGISPAAAAGIEARVAIELSGRGGGRVNLEAKAGRFALVEAGERGEDLLLSMSVGDYRKFLAGKLNATAAYMTRRLKIKGDIGLALKIWAAFK